MLPPTVRDSLPIGKNFPEEEIFPEWERNLLPNRETLLDREISIIPNREKMSPSAMKKLKIMICTVIMLILIDFGMLKDSKESEEKAT